MTFKDFKKNSSSTQYLRKKYNLGWYGKINLSQIDKVKHSLLNNHTEDELRTLKIGLNSQLEMYKQINLIIIVTTFILTTVLTTMGNYILLLLKPVDWLTDKQDHIKEYGEGIVDIGTFHMGIIYCIASVIAFSIIIYLSRYKWVVSINNIINESLEQKLRK